MLNFRVMLRNIKNSVLINENNWNEVVSNIDEFPFRISEINKLNKEIKLSKVSFKYNLEGQETYFNGSQEVTLHTGEYLVAANQQYGEVRIEEQSKPDLGVCIDINIDYLQQGLLSFLQPNEYLTDSDKSGYFMEERFFIKYKSNREFHRYMTELYELIRRDSFFSLQEMECEFIRNFIFHQTPHLLAYKNIPALKRSTRNELYTKMITARNLIQDSIYSPVSISTIARSLYISDFRFYHLFKDTFQVSPHRFFIYLKMQEALRLYNLRTFTWTEIAEKLHFADVQSFSKVFKKCFRLSPSAYAAALKSNL